MNNHWPQIKSYPIFIQLINNKLDSNEKGEVPVFIQNQGCGFKNKEKIMIWSKLFSNVSYFFSLLACHVLLIFESETHFLKILLSGKLLQFPSKYFYFLVLRHFLPHNKSWKYSFTNKIW